ncbi:hypothetical protein P3X46_016650 [Hevea brasiliensis]|uniref:DUF4378 domain-containing protein n=1 Tax=Hevea brasiliensis TaxID=3981 RepID=A0ABQ9LZU1_HEVBR|nr:uncharacterized protein LOC110654791 isoform X2 [Hevea brasiliensis]KAJ9173527.1 hypothetical protein P3X46_016650 [Hevea brasiliensis]
MGSISTITFSRQKPFLIENRPVMLKDYLRDDLSSCSSNGFKSFPRRQCCTTVRFLLEIDLNTKPNPKHTRQQFFKRSRSSKAASTTISALQKASEAVIKAVKLLPIPSSFIKSSSPFVHNRSRKGGLLLPRSLSRKLFKKSFWRKADHREREGSEIRRWRTFREFLEEVDKPSDHNTNQNSTSLVTTALTNGRLSTSSGSNSESWTDSESTAQSGNSESYSNQNAAARGQKDLPSKKKVSEVEGVTVGEDSIAFSVEKNTKEWPNEENKEQFSPVSVLDCPFQDEEDISPPFQRSLVRMEGAKLRFRANIIRFEKLAQLDPLNLEKQMELAGLEDETLKSPIKARSSSFHNNMFSDIKEDKSAYELLKLVKATIPSNHRLISEADSILLDFFREKIMENKASVSMVEGQNKDLEKELEVAQDWINGHPQEMFLGWEVKDSRVVYLREMERKGNWRNFDEEKEEMILELEIEIFTSLMNEVILDLLR